MKVILTQDIKAIGKNREIKEVKSGYAQNYLFPKGLAVEATKENMEKLEQKLAEERKIEEQLKKEAIKNKEALEKISVTIKTKVGPDGKLYGAITPKDICEAIEREAATQLDKRKIVTDTIKTTGVYPVIIKLYPKVEAKINVNIESE